MIAPASFRDVIALWPSPDAMASEIGAGVAAARKWRFRDSIPSEWWKAVLDSPTAGGAGLTAEMLTKLAARLPTDAEPFAEARV